jgi:hypothetical protein
MSPVSLARLLAGTASLIFATAVPAFDAPEQYDIRVVDLPVNDLVYDSFAGQLLASVPSRAGVGLGNTVSHIDPLSGQIKRSVFIGSEPGPLGLSSDATTLYVGMTGAALVRRYDVPGQVAGLQFGLGTDQFSGPYYAEDIEVLPGNANAIAVSRRNASFSPRHEGVAIYENGVQRPATTPDHTGSNSIAFGPDASTLYGYNNESTEFGFRRMTVDGTGVAINDTTANLIGLFGVTIQAVGTTVFASNGVVVDATIPLNIGRYVDPLAVYGLSAVAPDFAAGVVYGFTAEFSDRLTIFDLETFVPIDTYDLPTSAGFGSGGAELLALDGGMLALRVPGQDQFYLLTPVPEPSTWALLGAGLLALGWIARRRTAAPV